MAKAIHAAIDADMMDEFWAATAEQLKAVES
jgi:hypothetical protein